jgi:hypothetical protein
MYHPGKSACSQAKRPPGSQQQEPAGSGTRCDPAVYETPTWQFCMRKRLSSSSWLNTASSCRGSEGKHSMRSYIFRCHLYMETMYIHVTAVV